MDFSKRLVARSESKRAEFKKQLEEETESEDDIKAVISTTHEIVLKRNKKVSEDDKENSKRGHLSKAAHDRLEKLTALYSDKSPGPSSPIHKPHVRFSPSLNEEEEDETPEERRRCRDRLAEARAKRLADLAKVINDWEDESDKKVTIKTQNPVTKTIPVLKDSTQPSQSQKFLRPAGDKTVVNVKVDQSKSPSPHKKIGWDNKIIQSLEAQGYQRCDSQQHLIYDYKSPRNSPAKCSTSERRPSNESKSPVKILKDTSPTKRYSSPKNVNTAVLEMAAKYEDTSPSKKVKDPTELSIMERKALFEKNKGGAILPKVPFGTPVPAKILTSAPKPSVPKPEKNQVSQNAATKREWLTATSSPKDVVAQSILERQREIEELKNRWEKKKAEIPVKEPPRVVGRIPKPPPMPSVLSSPAKRNWAYSNHEERSPVPIPPPMPQQSSSPKRIRMGTRSPVRSSAQEEILSPIERNQTKRSPRKSDGYIGLDAVKPIRISPPKPGHIYPCISDIETESEAPESDFDHHEYFEKDISSEESTTSLGQAIVEASRVSKSSLKRANDSTDSENMSEEESRVMHEMDDFLDEALGGASPPKKSKDSFTSEIERGMSSCPSGSTRCDSFEFSTDEDARQQAALVHTVSMYRKQGGLSTPLRREVRMEEEKEWAQPKQEIPEELLVKGRITELQIEMTKQTTIISQASQALNLCQSRIEFSGSPEQVEAEKLLLLATNRRAAAVREIERLKVEKRLKPGGPIQDNEKGDLTIEQITLPIKPVPCSKEKVDNFVCLATSGATVLATQALPANRRENKIVFGKPLKFEMLYPDFTVTLEVYRLSTESSSDFIPHEVKYGICHSAEKKSNKLRLTPQRKTKTQRVIESPAGPNAVRSPAFQLIGFAVFSLREIHRTKFSLSKVPYGAPIDGSLELKMSTQLKADLVYKGFLTLFEEISGFGAWRRRWGVLSGTVISLWAYPEHEQEKIPIDTIDLSQINNKQVDLVSRDICARPNTFLLENSSGARYLMSADSLEDRVGWCKAINKSLYLLSAWGNQSKP